MTYDEMVEKIAKEYAAVAGGTAAYSRPTVDAMFDAITRTGFALVPLEATEEMEQAGLIAWASTDFGAEELDLILPVYKAMIAARPAQEAKHDAG